MIRNNVAAYIHYSAYDTANSTGKTGDVANHTLKLIIDGVVSSPTNPPEEIAAGEYRILLTAAESLGAKFICVAGVSSTPDINIIPAMVITDLLISGAAFVGCYTAWDTSANAPKINDAGNHTMTIAQDATSAGATNSPAQVDAVNVPGLYKVSVTTGEGTGKAVSIIGVSTGTTNIIPTELAPFTIDNAAISDVRLGTDYAEATLTGTAAIPGASDVRDGVAVDATTGTAAIPGAPDVRDGVDTDATTGTLIVPSPSDVRLAVPTDDTIGTAAIPVASDVRLNVPTDDTVGNYVPADKDKHQLGDSYGSLGTEFTGTKALTSFQLPVDVILEDEEILIFEGCDK